MLSKLRTGLCFRAALLLATIAALCFVAPPAVLAFGHGAHALACLAHADQVLHGGAMHHDHGMVHTKVAAATDGHEANPNSEPPGGHPRCCGLFCLSALPAADCGLELPADFGLSFEALVDPHGPSPLNYNLDPPPIPLLSA
jgi:hypothetical protein